MKVLITGGTGLVGNSLKPLLLRRGVDCRVAVRHRPADDKELYVGDLEQRIDWKSALEGVAVVFHLAARVHQVGDDSRSGKTYFAINTDATCRLAAASVDAGVQRFIYLSTVKVNGESSGTAPFRETDTPNPTGPYAKSKLEGEEAVRRVSSGSSMSFCVLRSPLVYGAGVRANFLRLIRTVERGIPLPFGLIDNARSLIYSENLADALFHCAIQEEAVNRTFLLSDGEDVSTPALIRRLADALGCHARLIGVPPTLLRLALSSLGRRDVALRLLSSLAVDTSAIRATGWSPPFTLSEGLSITCRSYRDWHSPQVS